jgi:hypothetical protein
MKLIPKILGLAIGLVIAFGVMAYWDVRHADMVCDNTQVADQTCHQRFIELDRLKRILDSNERRRTE